MNLTPLQYDSADEPWSFGYLVKAVDPLLPEIGPGTRVLDVGCGNGFWAGRLLKRGCTVVGIDPSQTGVVRASEAYPQIRFEQMEVREDLCERLQEDPFDLVLSLEVVEHLYSPRRWAIGCYCALRPGGTLVCSTPYHGYLKNLLIGMFNKWDTHFSPNVEGGHIKFWSRKTLTRLLADAGFQTQRLRFRGASRLPWLWRSLVVSVPR